MSFYDRYLPIIEKSSRFVLITGAADRTVPRQVDSRYPAYQGTAVGEALGSILRDERLIHWYAENCDSPGDRLSAIPLGCLESDGHELHEALLRESALDFTSRPLKALCCHRVRMGSQWQKREQVTTLAREHWSDVVDWRAPMLPDSFFDMLSEYPFTICVSGGGLDPAPKAWLALLAGSIPIIERTSIEGAYRDLPVAFVDEWNKDAVTKVKLARWLESLRRYYEVLALRKEVLHRLGMRYWWNKIAASPANPLSED